MTTWKIDNAHTQVNFSAKHMMVTTVRGTFHDVQGTIELEETDEPDRGASSRSTESVDTNFGARDAHLRSPTSSTPAPIRSSPSSRPMCGRSQMTSSR